MTKKITKKIFIDTDPGIDDAMAIFMAMQSPELEVLGLSTIFGNTDTEQATRNALLLCEIGGHENIPVAAGAQTPLYGEMKPVADFVHGKNGLGDIKLELPRKKASDLSGAQLIIDTVMKNPGEVTLVFLGPLTNGALALQLEPRIVGNVKEVVVMGGAFTVQGNSTPTSEANIYSDPLSADICLTAPWPITAVGLDVTSQVFLDEAFFNLFHRKATPAAQFIDQIFLFYRHFYQQHCGLNGVHGHDPTAIAYVLNPHLFQVKKGPVRVATSGVSSGQTLVDFRQNWVYPNAWQNIPHTSVCLEVDAAGVIDLIKKTLLR